LEKKYKIKDNKMQKGALVKLRDEEEIYLRAINIAVEKKPRYSISDQVDHVLSISSTGNLPSTLQIYSIKTKSQVAFCYSPGSIKGKMTQEQISKLLFMIPLFALKEVN